MTLAEHSAILAANPAYQKMRREKDAALAETARLLNADAQPILNDLKTVGFNLTSIWDLVNTTRPYLSAIPVLLKHLERPYMDRNREAIARALAVPAAQYGWPLVHEQYRVAPVDSGAKHGLAAALSAMVNDDRIDEIIKLVADQSNGTSRILLLDGLRRSRLRIAHDALVEFATDPVLAKEIASMLTCSPETPPV